jgi:hypothetical protein
MHGSDFLNYLRATDTQTLDATNARLLFTRPGIAAVEAENNQA